MEELIVVLFGLIVGSFLNVVIYRLPLNRSVVKPRSFCPHCAETVKFYDNVPVLSYILLRGKCRNCRASISFRYPLVELFTALTFWYSYIQFGLVPVYAGFAILFQCILLVLALIDFDHQILPDELTLGGSMVFLVYAFFNPAVKPMDAYITSVGTALVFTLLYVFYIKVRKIEGLGQGDIKMVLLLGAFLGANKLVIAVLVASLTGSLVGIFFIIFKGKNLKLKLPFGTFLSLGSIVSLHWGREIMVFIQSLYR